MQNDFNKSNFLNFSKKGFMLMVLWLGIATMAIPSAMGQLSGSYTVCPSGCDYDSLYKAVNDLQNKGVSGPVTVNIAAGNYNLVTGISITGIPGASGNRTVTFKGAGKTKTRLYGGGATNYGVIQVRNTGNITFRDMMIENVDAASYNHALHLYYSDSILVENCFLKNVSSSTFYTGNYTLYNYYSINNTFRDNTMYGGYYTVYNYSGNSTNGGHLFENNRVTGAYGYLMYDYYGSGNRYYNNFLDSTNATYGYGFRSGYEQGAKYVNNRVPGTGLTNGAFYITDPNSSTNTESFDVINNLAGPFIVKSANANNYGIYLNMPSGSNVNIKFLHNTVHMDYTDGVNFYMSDASIGGLTIMNNLFSRTSTGKLTDYNSLKAGSDVLQYNNYYNTAATNDYIEYNGTFYTTLADFKAAAAVNDHGKGAQNIQPIYKSSTDMHLDPNAVAAVGIYAGVDTDIDGDARCIITPTIGADASDYVKTLKPKVAATISGPDTIFVNSPAVYFSSGAGNGEMYKFYLDNVFQSDSIAGIVKAAQAGTFTLKLVTETCGGKDSSSKQVVAISPTKKPDTRFIADMNTILQGDVVRFTDLSRNGPSGWKWEISPDSTYIAGVKTNRFTYIGGTTPASQNPIVRFNTGGKYRVCLTVSNAIGSSQLCKADYIDVTSSINIGTIATTNEPGGFLYDDGGPNGVYASDNVTKSLLIDPCADEVRLVVTKFNLECNYDFLRIYDGADANGVALYSCGSVNGMTGDSNATLCANVCIPKSTDTFVAKSGKMYIEFDPDGSVSREGFAAEWSSKLKTLAKPAAGFTVMDTVCSNSLVNFKNTSTGDALNYLWDLDGDLSIFETTGKDAAFAYTIPGDYTITLIAYNCSRSDTFRKVLHVRNPPKPVVDFTVDNANPTVDDIVFLTPKIAQCVESYRYTIIKTYSNTDSAVFINGTSRGSASPQVSFKDTGCYSVTLIATNVTGKDSVVKNCLIKVRPGYCKPAVGQLTTDLGISHVKFNTIDNKSAQADKAYTSYVAASSTTVEIGVTYAITVERATSNNGVSYAAFIDWNGDGDFNDSLERAAYIRNLAGTTWVDSITIPSFSITGATVLRIAANLEGEPNLACGKNQFGEYEDYRLYIRPDLTRPVITLNGADTIKVEQGKVYTEPGYTAKDNLDGVITSRVKVVSTPAFNNLIPGTYVYTYDVEDLAGNQARTQTRVVIVVEDATAPDLTVAKPDTVYVVLGDTTFKRPVVIRAEDKVDGDLQSQVSVNNPVNVNVVDTFTITYSVADNSGNDTIVYRTVIVMDTTRPVLQLAGADTVRLNMNESYTDSGVVYSDNYYTPAQLAARLVITGSVNENKAGTYIITYSLTDPSGNGPVTVRRVVIVGDIEAPVLTLLGDSIVNLEVNTTFSDPGILISDNVDNITKWTYSGTFYQEFPNGMATRLGTYTVIYNVTDKAGNKASISRTINVRDTKAPVISILGNVSINVCRWTTYTDAGYDLSDNYWSDASISVEREGDFLNDTTDIPGVYTFRYKATDSSGNTGYSNYRIVNVLPENDFRCLSGMDVNELESGVSVYPNPTTGKLTLKLDLPGMERLQMNITDINGRIVARVNNNLPGQSTFQVDISNQPSGIYILNIVGQDYSLNKRIVLSK